LGWGIFSLVLICGAAPVWGQISAFSEKLIVHGDEASIGSDQQVSIIELRGKVAIVLDGQQCWADNAVIWLTPDPRGVLGEQQVDIVLLGHAKLTAKEDHLLRTGPKLLINTVVRGKIQLTADVKPCEDFSKSTIYAQALSIRRASEMLDESAPLTATMPSLPAAIGGTNASGIPEPGMGKGGPVYFSAKLTESAVAPDGTKALQLSGAVSITQTASNGDYVELLADNVVVFTSQRADAPTTQPTDIHTAITAAYLEGDVRIDYVPSKAKAPEQRLVADRVYYDFRTQKAVLTNVVFHSVDPDTQIPFIVRAQTMQQISHAEFSARNAEFTTSQFAVPTFSIRAGYAYIHQQPQDLANYDVVTHDDTVHIFGVPMFYWPALSGVYNTNPLPLLNFSAGNSSRYGFGVTTDWGLFQLLGQTPPKDLSIDIPIDFYSERGPGIGLNATYKGGFITDADQPWDFQGDFQSFFISDHGQDQLGGIRLNVDPPTEERGFFLWQHQQFFPDDWQVQVRLGYVSDPTYLEEYYQNTFDNALPYDAEFYAKRQRDTEVLSFLVQTDTTTFTTNADRQPDQFDVARLPEISYQRIGDSFADDQLTFFSANTGSGLKFDRSQFSLQDQGFYPGLSPGLPSNGLTGFTGDLIFRGDTRDEVDWPIALGQIKLVPYLMGELTTYSNSPGGDGETRFYGGPGVRATTTFWDVDDSIDSDLLNLHRIRHVIQPEINVFTSGTTVDAQKLYDFDSNIDSISDITAAQVAIHQHWDTMRGGPGRWESVDFLDFDIEGDFYPHAPPQDLLNPVSFRGLFFPSEPQTSVARQAINADLTWHIGDDTAFISDWQWNLDTHETAIAEAGIAVNRGARLSYYFGDAYIQALESQVISFNATYNLSTKYSLALEEAVDIGQTRAEITYLSVTRRFDVFALSVAVYHDGINNINGFSVNFLPSGQAGFSSPWHAND